MTKAAPESALESVTPSSRLSMLSGTASAAVAGIIGIASALADGIELNTTLAVASVVLGIGAYSGFTRMTSGVARRLEHTAWASVTLAVMMPSLFMLVLSGGADYAQRGGFSWAPLTAGLSLALLAACLPLTRHFLRHDNGIAQDSNSPPGGPAKPDAKLACLGVAFPAYIWVVVQIGRDNLPQACAAALITLLMSFHAARVLHEHATEGAPLSGALRLIAAAAPLHGAIIAAALLLDTR